MNNLLSLLLAGALLGGGLVACADVPLEPDIDVPEALKPPAGQVLTLATRASGVQIYTCKATAESADAPQFVWTFVAPEADLYDINGFRMGHHSAGPTWEADDGSKVVGRVLVQDSTGNPAAIPSLLLEAASNEGEGRFSRVKWIQRLRTLGGKVPSTPCTSANQGRTVRVPYTALYHFYSEAVLR